MDVLLVRLLWQVWVSDEHLHGPLLLCCRYPDAQIESLNELELLLGFLEHADNKLSSLCYYAAELLLVL